MRLGEIPVEITLIDPKSAFGWIDENALAGASLTSPGDVTVVFLDRGSEIGKNVEVQQFPNFAKYLRPAPEPLVGSIDIFDVYPGTKGLLYCGPIEDSNSHCSCGLYLFDVNTRERVLLMDCSPGQGSAVRWAKFSPEGGKLAMAVQAWNGKIYKRRILVYEVLDMGVQ